MSTNPNKALWEKGDFTQLAQAMRGSGDGLVDIVRVRNGEICYWPNLGHGRFGRKVTMSGGGSCSCLRASS